MKPEAGRRQNDSNENEGGPKEGTLRSRPRGQPDTHGGSPLAAPGVAADGRSEGESVGGAALLRSLTPGVGDAPLEPRLPLPFLVASPADEPALCPARHQQCCQERRASDAGGPIFVKVRARAFSSGN